MGHAIDPSVQLAPAASESIAAMLVSLVTAAPAAQSGAATEAAGEMPAPTFSELLANVEEEQEGSDHEPGAEESESETTPVQAMPAPQPQNIRVNVLPWHFAAPAFTAPEVHDAQADTEQPEIEGLEPTQTTPARVLPMAPPAGAPEVLYAAETIKASETTEEPPEVSEVPEQVDAPDVAPVSPTQESVPANVAPALVPFVAAVQPEAPQAAPPSTPESAVPEVPPRVLEQTTPRVATQPLTHVREIDAEVAPALFEPLLRRAKSEASEVPDATEPLRPQAVPANDAVEPEITHHPAIRIHTQPVNAEAPKPAAQSEVQAPVVYASDTPDAAPQQEKSEARSQPTPPTGEAEETPAEHVAFSGRILHPTAASNSHGGESPRAPQRPQHVETPHPVRLPPETPETPRTPLRTLTVTVEPEAGAERADIHFVHRNGVVDMAVRATNPELARVLRSDLPELVRDLEQQGFSSDLDSGEQHPEGRSRRQYERKDDDD